MLKEEQKKNLDISMGGDFDPVPADKYTVQIADVNLVQSFNKFKGKEEDRLNYMFIILSDKEMETDGETSSTRGRYLWHRVTPSLGGRSWLYKLVSAAYGRDLTKEEKESFDPEDLVGRQVDVMTEQNEAKNGNIYTNIISYQKTTEKLEEVEYEPTVSEAQEQESQPVESADEVLDEDPEEEIKRLEKEMEEKKKKLKKK